MLPPYAENSFLFGCSNLLDLFLSRWAFPLIFNVQGFLFCLMFRAHLGERLPKDCFRLKCSLIVEICSFPLGRKVESLSKCKHHQLTSLPTKGQWNNYPWGFENFALFCCLPGTGVSFFPPSQGEIHEDFIRFVLFESSGQEPARSGPLWCGKQDLGFEMKVDIYLVEISAEVWQISDLFNCFIANTGGWNGWNHSP